MLQRLDLGLDLPLEVSPPFGEFGLAEMRLRWYGSPEAAQADFYRRVMQAETSWEETEAAAPTFSWLEDAGDE